MNNFKKLGLSDRLVDILDQLGFTDPTPVQKKAIPLILTKDPVDLIGLAQTGTGKTAAFGLPLIDLLDEEDNSTQALIISPTRELGQQTADQIMKFSENHNLRSVAVYGGAPIVGQIKSLKKPSQIIIATPGRLIDLVKRKVIRLDAIKYVILDEADELLNMGFKEEIDRILQFTPDTRVTWLFSATMPKEIRRIIGQYMKDPIEVSVNAEEKTNRDISHCYVVTTTSNKLAALRRFMDLQPEMRGVLFCRTKMDTQNIADDLSGMGYGVEALHGDLTQSQRDGVMKRFKSRSMQLLIATDVAARGIDVNDLTHVIHHKLPDQLESYTHRSGRTGRAGKKGVSMAMINPRERSKIKHLEKQLGVEFEAVEVPSRTELKASRINHWADLIIHTQVDKEADHILSELHGQFANLSKEDILKRLITTQLDHLQGQVGGGYDDEPENLNAGGESTRESSGKGMRFFINIGSIDGVTKSDLAHVLADISGIKRSNFNNISVQKNCSYFDVEGGKDKGFADKFKGYEIDDRVIRVNRDEKRDGGKSKMKPNTHGRGRGRSRSKRKMTRSKKRR